MKWGQIKKNIKKLIGLCMLLVIMITVNVGRVEAMELIYEENEDFGRSRLEEYEMNAILEMLEIKEWKWPFYQWDKVHGMKIDEPLGKYTAEKLRKYMGDNTGIEVVIEYFWEGVRHKNGDWDSIQVIKIYESGVLTRLGHTMWHWQDDSAMVHDYFKLGDIKMEEMGLERAKEDTKYGSVKADSIFEPTWVMKLWYKGDVELEAENIWEVMKIIMTIQDVNELHKLVELPLTQKFYNQCIEGFPFFEKPDGSCRFYHSFFGIGAEGKIICMCVLNPENNEKFEYDYFVEMQIVNGKIDSMDIELLGRCMPAG